VRLLLDTHSFLWFVRNDPQLSATARSLIADPANTVLVSPASYWEIAIKISIGKYTLNVPYATFMHQGITATGFTVLHILPAHTELLTSLLFHHRDPFDRLLIAQAMAERVPLVSIDQLFDPYGIQRLW
jgi:PIN domain nuclease of toxin-antitoxin system